MMTIPGLALFYCGMVRKKNVLATMAQSLAAVATISILWVCFGYTLAFVGDGPWLGTLDRWFLAGMTMESVNPAAKTIPEALFMLYQMTFAIITVALVAGSVADRMRFSAYLLFSIGWFTFVYLPLAHWVWGGGFLATMGVLDFAGGLVVHLSAGIGGLVAAKVLGRRHGYGSENLSPFDLSLADVQTCVNALQGANGNGGPVFVVGYCYGGSIAWFAATRMEGVAAASSYYGSLIPGAADEVPKVPVILHFGRYDQGIPMEGVEKVIAANHPNATVYIYEAGHGFNSDRRKDYHEPSSDLAKERTLELFEANGG